MALCPGLASSNNSWPKVHSLALYSLPFLLPFSVSDKEGGKREKTHFAEWEGGGSFHYHHDPSLFFNRKEGEEGTKPREEEKASEAT